MQTKLAAGIVSAGLLLGAATARGHHAFSAEFDANSPIKLEGTVAKVEWVNPHAWIYVDVKKADGTMEQWKIEGGTPNALFRRGFTKDSLKIGTAIVVTGFRAKDGNFERQRSRFDVPGRTQAVSRLVRHRRARRWGQSP